MGNQNQNREQGEERSGGLEQSCAESYNTVSRQEDGNRNQSQEQ